jgi:drug/metabolite transporter (DMT)-like permease
MTSSWMLVAGFLFATMGVFVKLGSAQFGAAELAFYRSLVTFVAMLGLLGARRGRGTLRTRYFGMHLLRAVVGSVSLIGYFYAITELPLATAQTLNYTSPLFLAIGTVVVLGERFSGRLVAAIVVGSLSYSTLVFGAAATWLVWSERMAALEWAGMLVIVASGIMAMRAERREEAEEAGFES